ncbi:glycosyltransferase 87 family protein [Actinoplanes sp. NPDC049599]|uniref:glycosyltransferase 87 family protein n=1 Tax=Actinoplanes sp. NPDC049599 TaxID=3363903 RepID=UPI0037BC1FC2
MTLLAEPAPRTRRRWVRTLVICGLAALLGLAVRAFAAHYRFFDMVIYHDAIRWWGNGGELYDYAAPVRGELGFTYPPFAAFVLQPVARVPAETAGWLNAVGSVLALTVVLAVLLAPIAARHGRPPRHVLAAAVPLALCTEPVRQTLGFGQVNLWLFALVVLDLLVLGRAGSRWAGAGVGIATAIKLTPGLFIGYLLVTGQWRAARTATLTTAGLTVGAFLLAPAESLRYFGDLLWQTERVGAAAALTNQSLSGLLARLAGTVSAPAGWWLTGCAVVLVVGLRRARLAHAAGDEPAALTLTGLTANLVSPMSWTHHLVFLPVAALLLADLAARRRDPLPAVAAATVYALSVVSPIWLTAAGPGGMRTVLLQNTFTLMLLALVALLPWREPALRPVA